MLRIDTDGLAGRGVGGVRRDPVRCETRALGSARQKASEDAGSCHQ